MISVISLMKLGCTVLVCIVFGSFMNSANADTVSLRLKTEQSVQLGSGSIRVSHDDIHPTYPSEEGYDLWDGPWYKYPQNPLDKWLKPFAIPYGVELANDVRPSGSLTPIEIYFSLVTKYGTPREFSNIPIYCNVSFNLDTGNFEGKTIVFQQQSLVEDGTDIYPVYDLRRIIGTLHLFDVNGNPLVLNGTYNDDDILAKGTLYFDRLLSDLNDDGDVDVLDLLVMGEQWLESGYALAGDISGELGKPDGKVDIIDLSVFASEWLE